MVASPISACTVMHVSSNYGTQVPDILCLGFVMSSIVVPVIVNYMDPNNASKSTFIIQSNLHLNCSPSSLRAKALVVTTHAMVQNTPFPLTPYRRNVFSAKV